jgi:hypothetical protein
VALKPALWDRPYEGALAGVVEMVWGSMFEAAGRVRVDGQHSGRCFLSCLGCFDAGESHAATGVCFLKVFGRRKEDL